MTDSETQPCSTDIESRLREKIKESELNLQTIATGAGISYLPFYRWVTGRKKSIKLSEGEALWVYFTGSKFQ